MLPEEWLPVKGYESFYLVSDRGRIRSLRRPGLILRPCTNRGGYPQIVVYGNKTKNSICVHLVVARAFLGPCPKGMECHHIDGNKANNNVDNLRWVTPKENSQHAVSSGLHKFHRGEKHHKAILTKSEVIKIRKLHKQNVSYRKIAKSFGVSRGCISSIVSGKNWAHIQSNLVKPCS